MKLAARTRGNLCAPCSRRDGWIDPRWQGCVDVGFEPRDDLAQAEHLAWLEFGLLHQLIIDEGASRRAKVFE